MKKTSFLLAVLLLICLVTDGCSSKASAESQNFGGNETVNKADTLEDETQDFGDSETLSKADTSGMDFTVDSGDADTPSPAEGELVDLSALSSDTYSITSGGSYTLSGSRTDTMILVDAENADVTLILNGVTIQNSKGPAVYIRSADKVTLSLASGTTNTISDGDSYSVSDQDSALDGAIFSKPDLTVSGSGTLILKGNNKFETEGQRIAKK